MTSGAEGIFEGLNRKVKMRKNYLARNFESKDIRKQATQKASHAV